ncbi:hypothetical protein GCM10025856_02790 [Methylophaga marina]|uniref:hypothetical protein n=1 Tax=Methylophaga marina TaxID=45495 RepID=UPI0025733A96|nr:hypothetical protein [Methylophaga marina]BDZ72560.1 hypothetical protein GCM10025856_02790 [Methylophaga marina]
MFSSKRLYILSLISVSLITTVTSTKASLDLLAGVEAGIDTDTAMTTHDLQQTQKSCQQKPLAKVISGRMRSLAPLTKL